MKKIFAIIGVAALLATVSATAQNAPVYAPTVISVPPLLAAGTTNLASAPVLFVGKQGNVGFEATINGTSSGATNVYYFAPSVSGVNFDTNAADLLSVTVAASGTNQITVAKNLSASGVGYFKLLTIVTTGTATNGAHYYGTKISAP